MDPLDYWMRRSQILEKEIHAICKILKVDQNPTISIKIGESADLRESAVRLGLIITRIAELKDVAEAYREMRHG